MSLDKFVMRGFTSSLGESSGQWVAKDPASQAPGSFMPKRDDGTSFLMGGGVGQPRRGGNDGKPFAFKDPDYFFDKREIMNGGGATKRDSIPSGCFGGGAGNDKSGTSSQAAIMGVFMALITIVLALIAMSGTVKDDRPKFRNRDFSGKQDRQGPQRPAPPAWYR
jgi:hypothetical protein